MKKVVTLLAVVFLLLLGLLPLNCKKEAEEEKDNEQAKVKRSQEVRDSLKGEIAFYSRSNASIKKVVAKIGGSGVVLSNNVTYIAPKWSYDGMKVASVKLKTSPPEPASGWYLTITSRESPEQNEWFLGEAERDLKSITWSPDGKYIAALFSLNSLHYFETATGKIIENQLLADWWGEYTAIAWRPADSRIAISLKIGFDWSIQKTNSIWLFDAFDDNPQKDPNNCIATNQHPAQPIPVIDYMDWSPDGSMLAYSSTGGYEHIYIVNADGSGNREIVLSGLYQDEELLGFAPAWAPNNKQIVYTGITDVVGSTLVFGLFVTDINGSYNVNLKTNGELPDWY